MKTYNHKIVLYDNKTIYHKYAIELWKANIITTNEFFKIAINEIIKQNGK